MPLGDVVIILSALQRKSKEIGVFLNHVLMLRKIGVFSGACECNATIVGSITTRGNELLFI